MFSYRIISLERPTHITFCISNSFNIRVDLKEKFPEYCMLDENKIRKYFVNLNTEKLVIIENENEIMKSLRSPTEGNINQNDEYYRPATQFDIDENEENYNTDNWKLYKYLKNIYCSNEIFLSEDESISVHIRKSQNGKDLILMRFEKDERNNFKRVSSLNLEYAVRELEYCKGYNLRKKYEELIVKNLDTVLVKKHLLPYVEGVFKPTKNKYDYDYDSD